MMKDLRIKDWGRFQHFKDRKPPWIKLYRDILDDPDWHELDGDSAKVLVMLWLVASEDCNKEGRLPITRKLAFRLRLSEEDLISHLKKLAHYLVQEDIKPISSRYQESDKEPGVRPQGDSFYTELQGDKEGKSSLDNTMISDRYQLDAPETETEGETEGETEVPENGSDTLPLKIPFTDNNQLQIANYLAEKILERDPKHHHLSSDKRDKAIQAWSEDIEKLHRLDGREWDQVWRVTRWCTDDEFWSRNILSGSKLRKQFSKLLLQMPVDGKSEPEPEFMQGAL